MTRRDWWLGVGAVCLTLLANVGCPRHEYIVLGPDRSDVIRHDRWTGDHQHMWIEGRGTLTDPLSIPIQPGIR